MEVAINLNKNINENLHKNIVYTRAPMYNNIKKTGVDIMSKAFADFAERLVPISDFSQGKAGKIFRDIAENNSEYIVLKNNQPIAVVVSVKEYKETQEKISKLEKLLEAIEDKKLSKLAESRKNDKMVTFDELVKKEGFIMEELQELSGGIEFEE